MIKLNKKIKLFVYYNSKFKNYIIKVYKWIVSINKMNKN